MNLVFDRIKYNQRNIVETIFSVVKRKLGETLRAKKFRYQVKEIKIKLIIYNIDKKGCRGNWHQIEDFYRAEILALSNNL